MILTLLHWRSFAAPQYARPRHRTLSCQAPPGNGSARLLAQQQQELPNQACQGPEEKVAGAEWRELALDPRQAKIHDKLVQGTKELPPLVIGDHIMIQNQLGNKPKRWDMRGVVV